MVLGTATLAAQENSLALSVYGGAQSPWGDLDAAGTAQYESGYNVGAAASLVVHPNIAFRAQFTWARSDAVAPVFETASFSRFFYGGDLRIGHQFENGLQPYGFAGIAGVRISRQDSDDDAVNTPAARLGVGLSYAVPGTRFSVFGEAGGWYYKFYGWPGLDSYQWDGAYSVGVSWDIDLGIG